MTQRWTFIQDLNDDWYLIPADYVGHFNYWMSEQYSELEAETKALPHFKEYKIEDPAFYTFEKPKR